MFILVALVLFAEPGSRSATEATDFPTFLARESVGVSSRPQGHAGDVHYCGARMVVFSFMEQVEGISGAVPSVSPLQQQEFRTAFCTELAKLETWAAKERWAIPLNFPALHVNVSAQYKIARTLVPQWMGIAGTMEFPAFWVAMGEAGIMHELVHIYFPNANRMLAEGFAVYLQNEIGANPAPPNFKEPLDCVIRFRIEREVEKTLDLVRFSGLDRVSTPTNLAMRIGRSAVTHETGWTYMIAGSFVKFIIDEYKMDKFRAIYLETPLVPLGRNAGPQDRWNRIYNASLKTLENKWRDRIKSLPENDPLCTDFK